MALRTPLSVTPHLYMGDSTGRPLDMGTVYFGEQDKDPEFYPINLFSDDAMTLPLAQPIHTKGGYLYDKGDMVEPHAKEIIYSVKVLDSYGRKVFYKGAMMRNSWNDDVIEQINAALVSTAEQSAQVAEEIANKAVISSGFVTVDSFELGATLTQRNQALRHAADGKLYRWAGDLPKTVPAGSTPTSSGGIATNAWLEVSDTVLRTELSSGVITTLGRLLISGIVTSVSDYKKLTNIYFPAIKNLTQFSIAGFWQPSDGGGDIKVWRSDVPKSMHDGGDIIDPDKLTELVSQSDYGNYFTPSSTGMGCLVTVNLNLKDLDIAKYGAAGDSPKSELINTIEGIAFAQKRRLVSNKDITLDGTVKSRCAFICDGTITIDISKLPALELLEDVQVDESDKLAGIMPKLKKGESELGEYFNKYEGYSFMLQSTDFLCNRDDSVTPQTYYKRDSNFVGRNGTLVEPLTHSYLAANKLVLGYSEPTYSKVNINVAGEGAEHLNNLAVVNVFKSNAVVNAVVNNSSTSYAPLGVGVAISGCANSVIIGEVDGTDKDSYGYAYLFTSTYNCGLYDSKSFKCRKSFDMTFAYKTTIDGGVFWGTPAAHVAWGLDIQGATLHSYATDGSNSTQDVLSLNGTNINITRCKLYHKDFIRPRFIRFRSDNPIRGGYLIVRDNDFYTEDNGKSIIVEMTTKNGFDYGADIGFFDEIAIEDNRTHTSGIVAADPLNINNTNTINPASYPSTINIKNNLTNATFTGDVLIEKAATIPPATKSGGVINVSEVNFFNVSIPVSTNKYVVNISNCYENLSLRLSYLAREINIDTSSIKYFTASESTGINANTIIRINKCTINPIAGTFRYSGKYMFTYNYFKGLMDFTLGDIVLSSGNFGVEQSFAKNGVYVDFAI